MQHSQLPQCVTKPLTGVVHCQHGLSFISLPHSAQPLKLILSHMWIDRKSA